MTLTMEEIAEAGKRRRAQRKAQGLPMSITDPAALAPLARSLNEALSEAPLDNHALRVEEVTRVA